MLVEPNPLDVWGELVRGELTNAEVRALLEISVFEFISITSCFTPSRLQVSYGFNTTDAKPQPTLVPAHAELEAWVTKKRPHLLKFFQAAMVEHELRLAAVRNDET